MALTRTRQRTSKGAPLAWTARRLLTRRDDPTLRRLWVEEELLVQQQVIVNEIRQRCLALEDTPKQQSLSFLAIGLKREGRVCVMGYELERFHTVLGESTEMSYV